MPIDASIPLQAKNPQFESPTNQLAMMSDAMKIGEMQRGLGVQNELRNLYSQGVDVNTPEGFKRLASVDPVAAMKLRTQGLEGRKLQSEVDTSEFKLTRDKTNNAILTIANFDTPQAALDDLSRRVKAGEMPLEVGQQHARQIQSMPWAQYKTNTIQSLLTAQERTQSANTQRGQDISAESARRGQDLSYKAATQPVFSEASGGFITRPTAANPSSTVIPLTNPEATTKGQVIAKGKNLVADVATDMAAAYGTLKDLGGIKSRENSPQKNLSAALQSSMVGQVGGSLMGTPEQDARDAIKSQRPILVQAIVKATGMSSQQINSNQELKNMLDAATDPGLGYETNIKTLNKINKRFGLGEDIVVLPTTTSNANKVSVGTPQKTNPNIDALLEKYK
jgi:2-hydroxychromene-2-carboxylate isomerase